MSDEINYANNPLHGVSLKTVLTELVDHYGFEILNAYLAINCFKTNASIESSEKFLKKTEWAREKVEVFYLYEYKNLPRVSSEQFLLPPRDRIVPEHQKPGEPKELSLEDAERLREKRAKKAAEHKGWKGDRPNRGGGRSNSYSHKSDNSNKGSYSNSDNGYNYGSSKSTRHESNDDTSNANESSTSGPVDPWAKSR